MTGHSYKYQFFHPQKEVGRKFFGFYLVCLVFFSAAFHSSAFAATVSPISPAVGASCTASVLNQNAPIDSLGNYDIGNIPAYGPVGVNPPVRVRAVCSDGTVGQTSIIFPTDNSTYVVTGPIVWGQLDLAPVGLAVTSPSPQLSVGQSAQLSTRAVAVDLSVRDVTTYSQGTIYNVSNPLLATISQDGLVNVLSLFSSGSSANLIVSAMNEGGVASSYELTLGSTGTLTGHVYRADGVTPVVGAQVSVIRHAPMGSVGTASTDSSGKYTFANVNAGAFSISVLDLLTGDQGVGTATIQNQGDVITADIKLNGLGQVTVNVVDGNGVPVNNAQVTLTTLTSTRDVQTASTGSNGSILFSGVAAGQFTVSTWVQASQLVGTALGQLPVNGNVSVTLKLEPVGTIQGTVLGTDGVTLQAGVQVRLISRAHGLESQQITGSDGSFSFSPLPLGDGPFTLAAYANGRLQIEVPGLVLNTANQVLQQNIRFAPSGSVTGQITSVGGQPVYAQVTLQQGSGLGQQFTTNTDSNGNYQFGGIPLGPFTVSATNGTLSASGSGTLQTAGGSTTVNLQLAGAYISGTVFQRDGKTPAGAGVNVYLQPGNTTPILNALLGVTLGSTQTDANGKYSFQLSVAGSYFIQAESGADRGRAQATVSDINSGQIVQTNVIFIGQGIVSGSVRDGSGNIQANVPVTVTSTGLFPDTWSTVSDANGNYSIAGVYAGNIVSQAVQGSGPQAAVGVAYGRIINNGDNLSLELMLSGVSTINAHIWKSDGVTVPKAPIQVVLQWMDVKSNSYVTIDTQTLTTNSYQNTHVPLGQLQLIATESTTGDMGLGSFTVDNAGETHSLDLRMLGQGAVQVSVTDDQGLGIAGAQVQAVRAIPFNQVVNGVTDAKGNVTLQPLFNGDFTVTVTDITKTATLYGNASGTLSGGVTVPVSITLTAQPTGTISGTVYQPNGTTPAANMWVGLHPGPASGPATTFTDAHGNFTLANVLGGQSYTVQAKTLALDQNGNPGLDSTGNYASTGPVRAQSMGANIATQGQVVNVSMTMLGSGTVTGTVVLPNGAAVGGPIQVTYTNPDPVYGMGSTISTDATGAFTFTGVPIGNFTLQAGTVGLASAYAQANGRISVNGGTQNVVLQLVNSTVTLPRRFYDANNYEYDITGTGLLGTPDQADIFGGQTVGANAGMHLNLLVSGIPVPVPFNSNQFYGVGQLSANGQELTLQAQTINGLNVTRRVFVPSDSYFTRFIDTLQNTTANPITVDVQQVSYYNSGVGNTRIVDTTLGNTVLSLTDPVNRDHWLIVDDSLDGASGLNIAGDIIPPTGDIFDGVGARLPVSTATYQLVGPIGQFTSQWNAVTVNPGQSISLMQLVYHQLSRAIAHDAAVRLEQLPPEVLTGLSSEDLANIANFNMPLTGTSTLPALPVLNVGTVNGQVLSGDATTPIGGARVHFKSLQEFYGRDFYTQADVNGQFSFTGMLNGNGSSTPLPLYSFNVDATHPMTGAVTPPSEANFAANSSTVTQNLIFIGTGNLRGQVQRPGGTVGANAHVTLTDLNNVQHSYQTFTDGEGNFVYTGVGPSDYVVNVSIPQPQQIPSCCGIEGQTNLTVVAGLTTVQNVVVETVGTITGTVYSASGTPIAGAVLNLTDSLGRSARQTSSDSGGNYTFTDVKLGATTISAVDSSTSAEATVTVTVSANQVQSANLTLQGFGTINVQVNSASGHGVAGIGVNCQLANGNPDIITSAASGQSSFNMLVGSYTCYASYPGSAVVSKPVTITGPGDIENISLTLPPVGSVHGIILRPDGQLVANGFPYTIKRIDGSVATVASGNTDGAGNYSVGDLALGTYVLTAYDPIAFRFADTSFAITSDGVDVTVNLTVQANRIALPSSLADVNRFNFNILQDGSLVGSNGGFTSVSNLTVNGQPFTGATSALLDAANREFTITQATPVNGVTVSRKVYVPLNGYFARYLEEFNNPGTTPVTLNVQLTHSDQPVQIIATSQPGNLLNANTQWVVLDDQTDGDTLTVTDANGNPQRPTTAHIFGQAGAALSTDTVTMNTAANGNSVLQTGWSKVVVPAGGQVALMHFEVQEIDRAGTQYAAQRLVQLPPEALQDMQASDAQSVVNFSMPSGLNSSVPALPSLTAAVSGNVYEGDGVTPVNGTRVMVQSSHPLFHRIWGYNVSSNCITDLPGTFVGSLVSGASAGKGEYTISGNLTAGTAIPLPVDSSVTIGSYALPCNVSGHPVTQIDSPIYTPAGAASITQNIVFNSGILFGSISGPLDFSVTSGSVYPANGFPGFVNVQADGSYTFPGLPPGTYDMLVATSTPQGANLRGEHDAAVVTLGKTTVTDIALQSTGTLVGTVVTAGGVQSVNAPLVLTGPAQSQQYNACQNCGSDALPKNKGPENETLTATSDSLGRYNFAAVPLGTYTLSATDPVSKGVINTPVVISQSGINTLQNMVLYPTGTASLTVTTSTGAPLANANVYLTAASSGPETVAGRTDSNGHLTIANIPGGGAYSLRVSDPRYPTLSALDRHVSGNVTVQGAIQPLTVTMLAVAQVNVLVQDGDNGNVPLSGAAINLQDSTENALVAEGNTGATGTLLVPAVVQGSVNGTAVVTLEGTPVSQAMQFTINAADDQQTKTITVVMHRSVGSVLLTALDGGHGNVPLVGASVTLRDSSGQARSVGSTDSNGHLLVPGIAIGAYTITVTAHFNSGNFVQLASGTISQASIGQSQPVSVTVKPTADVQITVLNGGSNNAIYPGVSVSYQGSSASTPTAMGVTDANGQITSPQLTPDTYTFYAQAINGSAGHAVVTITAANAGQVVSQNLTVTPPQPVLGVFNDGNEQYLYSVTLAANDVLGLSIQGSTVGSVAASPEVAGAVYDPNGVLKAKGYGAGPGNNYQQTNTQGDLTHTVAASAGVYTIAVSPGTGMADIGGYRLSASDNATAIQINQVPGTKVSGVLYQPDGVTPITSARVYVLGSGTPQLRMSTLSDANGVFSFTNVPLGNFTLTYNVGGQGTYAQATGSVANINVPVTQNLIGAPTTTINVSVVDGSGKPVPNAYITISDPSKQLVSWTTDANGQYLNYAYTGYGPLTFTAQSNLYSSYALTQTTVSPQNGVPVNVVLAMIPGTASGVVTHADGTPVVSGNVEVLVASTLNPLYGVTTDNNGNFRLTNLPVGQALVLQLYDDSGMPDKKTFQVPASGQLTGLNLQLPGVATLQGHTYIKTGVPDANGSVTINWTTGGQAYSLSANVDSTGAYSIAGVPLGVPLSVSAADFQDSLSAGPVAITANSNGQVVVQDINYNYTGTMVLVEVVYADNSVLPSWMCDVTLSNSNARFSNTGPCAGVLIIGAPAGVYNVNIINFGPLFNYSLTTTVVAGQTNIVKLPFSVVSGVVKYSDGTVVPNPSVTATDQSGNTYYTVSTDANGNYRFEQVPASTLTVNAQDSLGLTTTATGVLTNGGWLQLNLTMPATGDIHGTVVDASGNPAPNIAVNVYNATTNFNAGVYTDSNGQYDAPHVPLGSIQVTASTAAGISVNGPTVQLSTSGQSQAVNMQLPAQGAITGLVTYTDGLTPMLETILMQSADLGAANVNIFLSTPGNSSGIYSIPEAPVGHDVVYTLDYGKNLAGIATANVSANATAQANIKLGTAAATPYVLAGSGTTQFTVSGNGSLSWTDTAAYPSTPINSDDALTIAGFGLNSLQVVQPVTSGIELSVGPYYYNGLSVTRRVRSISSGGYARVLDYFTNPTSSPISVPVALLGDPSASSTNPLQLVVGPASNGNSYVVQMDNAAVNPFIAYVFSGTGTLAAGVPTTATFTGQAPSSVTWTVTVPPGQSVGLLSYAIYAAPSAGVSSVQTLATSLATGNQPNMFDGLSTTEKSNIINFGAH